MIVDDFASRWGHEQPASCADSRDNLLQKGDLGMDMSTMLHFSRLSARPRRPLPAGTIVAFDLPPGLPQPIMLSIANPAHAAALAGVAVRIAAARQTGVVFLHVVRERPAAASREANEPSAWPVLAAASAVARQAGVPAGWIVRQAEDVGQAIRETAREIHAGLIMLGWRGTDPQQDTSLAAVLEDPLSDVVVVAGQNTGQQRRILVSVGSGAHAALAARLAAELAGGHEIASITALHVVPATSSPRRAFAASERQFRRTLGRAFLTTNVTRKTLVNDDTAQAIVDELATGYDAVLMGTSRESIIDRLAFGEAPQRVAEARLATVIVARRHSPILTRVLRDAWQALTDALPTLTAGEREEVRASIREGARSRADFFVMIGLAAVLAGLGLLLNSPAVIIGAMLVAPLMSAIVGLGLGVVEGDTELLGAATWASLRGALVAIAIGAALGLLIPDASATPEIMARTRPSLLDLGVALASGAAGAYAVCRKGVSASLAGVAIAAALVPPLATVGIGLALRRGNVAGGALLLFITNLIAIAAAGGLVFLMLGFAPASGQKERRSVLRRGLTAAVSLLGVITLILGLLSAEATYSARRDRAVRTAVTAEIGRLLPEAEFVELRQADGEDGALQLLVTVHSPRQYSHETVLAFQSGLATRIQQPVALLLNVIPATRLDPLVPPTLTPAPPPTATQTSSAVAQDSLSPVLPLH